MTQVSVGGSMWWRLHLALVLAALVLAVQSGATGAAGPPDQAASLSRNGAPAPVGPEDSAALEPPTSSPPQALPTTFIAPAWRAPAATSWSGPVALGAWTAPTTGWSFTDVTRAVTRFEAVAGRRLNLVHVYEGWDEVFPDRTISWIVETGRTPLVSWAVADTQRIVAGDEDATIRARAQALAALGVPVLLRWGYEMDGADAAPFIHDAASYIAAWRHLRRLFRQEGADNVAFVWSPNAWAIRQGYGQAFYPGDDAVDWIGGDGYNWAPARPGAPWESFTSIFQSWYDWAAPHGKPLIVAEFGVMERQAGEKAAWWESVADGLLAMPAIRAVSYFDENKMDKDGRHDWRVTSTAASASGFRALASSPLFAPG